jgi:hypothetical protein
MPVYRTHEQLPGKGGREMSGQRVIIMNAGSSYFEHVENYYGSNACEQNSCRNAVMPAELKTERAQRIRNNLMEIGMVTEDFMPSGLSSSEAAILANQIGTELKIDNIWSVFGNYWGPNPNSMRAAYNRGMDQKKTIPFLEKVMPAIRG